MNKSTDIAPNVSVTVRCIAACNTIFSKYYFHVDDLNKLLNNMLIKIQSKLNMNPELYVIRKLLR